MLVQNENYVCTEDIKGHSKYTKGQWQHTISAPRTNIHIDNQTILIDDIKAKVNLKLDSNIHGDIDLYADTLQLNDDVYRDELIVYGEKRNC